MAQLTCRRGPPCNCPELAWLPASAETDTGRAAESASEWPAPRAETPWTHLWKQADRGSGLTVSASPASSGGALCAASEGPGGAAGPARPGPALAGGGRDRPGKGQARVLAVSCHNKDAPAPHFWSIHLGGQSSEPISHGAADCDAQSGLKSTDSVLM